VATVFGPWVATVFGQSGAWEISTYDPIWRELLGQNMVELQTIEQGTSSEELAYMLLEEARLRCELLVDDSNEADLDPDCLSLTGLYGDIGLAGYYASARLEPARRKVLSAQAHARCQRGIGGTASSVRAFAEVTAAATRTVERALTVTDLLDHMHLAHMHVMSACEALDTIFALQP
jgi:hypothetical protein